MDAQQFAYWLQGFAELQPEPPTAEQWQSIREHLSLVFTKVTPPVQYPGIVKEGPLDQIRPQNPAPSLPPRTLVRSECGLKQDAGSILLC